MKINSKTLLLASIGLVVLIGLSIGGYFLVVEVDKVHDENLSSLEGFGSKVIPLKQGPDSDSVSVGEGGVVQIPSSIGEKKLSATEKIIISLSKEKETLVKELTRANTKIVKLEKEITLLRGYRDENERFAPLPLQEERDRAIAMLKEYLETSPDAERFNEFQQNAMTLASANVYMEVLRRFRLSFDEQQKDQIISQHLPVYAFCLGDGIGFVANSRQEERLLLKYLRTEDVTILSKKLEEDLLTISTPCLKLLNDRINTLI